MSSIRFIAAVIGAALTACAAHADIVRVDVVSQIDGRYGNTAFNNGPLGSVQLGNTVTMSFTVDSASFVTGGMSSQYRGYFINPSSFTLTMGSVTTQLQSPYLGSTPMFVLANNDPGVDRFSLSTSVDFNTDVSLNAVGQFANYSVNYSMSYGASAIGSLDILSALGTYTWTNLQQPGFYLNDGFVTRLEMYSFDHMTISLVPTPGAAGVLALSGMLIGGRRRRSV